MLYNKYRPQFFRELVGQEFSKKLLINILKQKADVHSFLFYGPNGTGKTTSARLFSRAINCENFLEGEDICGKCEACKISREEGCTDIIEIDGATNNGVEFIREFIKNNAIYPPLLLKKKIYLIDEAHCLSIQAWNSLLKIIEEPPSHLILIFLTTEIHKIIPTILSRCQKLLFSPLEENTLISFLEKISSLENKETKKELLKKIFEESNGSVRESLVLLEKTFINQKSDKEELIENLEGIETISLELLNLILKSNYSESLAKLSENLSSSTKIFEIILDRLLELSFYSMSSFSKELLVKLNEQQAEEFLKLNPNLSSMINFLAPTLSKNSKSTLKSSQFAKFVLLNLLHANLKESLPPQKEVTLKEENTSLKNSESKKIKILLLLQLLQLK
ncbi:DNA polymerase III subunit gamma/tau [Mycoplasma suis]|uniref:DNA polymerase III subunit gamma/tau n=1 Tax=Mycoplasma suis (strain Illinois) TaxID=768700 RepID=F0QSB1_MYCSL|nr:DNA polymerase III subunit gamma/tau [Mycoplasma suis]ADX98381.1 DNA polymerase III, subunits gamma and tau [Mycoplasma suis str. Illinois]